ncbi:L-threonylcarbamoyladenylate synthase [Ulvibacter litoralis]|uniref:L-threonylcarbamoyladenylate synthase n=1 Tax=Ulvibacter litoralis TaxID=227084 RepID=A0A1G7ENW4_9FLAO|nr:L-threonylcarbamoyladenylate synthase [Ulvibacter litoralis]GHC54415.1 translation factor Sua5 [Ulvibacter litoralis]SDE65322.1 L-threonylcarbamoyladenylate synthase [Ulvibacter litoralis]
MKTELENALAVLKKGGLILYPTDTVWGIGCDSTHPKAIERIYELKKRANDKSLICLVSDLRMLEQFVEQIPKGAYDVLKFSVDPTTIVYDNPIRVSETLIAADDSLAYRIVDNEFCQKLIRKLKRPIVSTSANISGEKTPLNFQEISQEILDGVDYVVNLQRDKKAGKPSTIIKIKNDGTVTVLRK